jgi:serine/threonine protein kinase
LKRTLLKYEAKIFTRLDGHPAIPKLYGYGHFEHFEYLAMELLGNPLEDDDKLAQGFSIQEVADIGVQLVRCFFLLVIIAVSHRGLS